MKYLEIEHEKAVRLREDFINAFVNKTSSWYERKIATLHQYEDGVCYGGYLWETLKGNESYELECSMEGACDYLRMKDAVYVMQDIHSGTRGYSPCVFACQFSKDAVLKVSGGELADRILKEWQETFENWETERFFPEDIYCFDDDMEWFVIFTHEGWDQLTAPERGLDEDDYIRICFAKGALGRDEGI